MEERPILFSGPMVMAILDGRKTQTRRVVKPQTIQPSVLTPAAWKDAVTGRPVKSPYGYIGDRLWVKETFVHLGEHGQVFYRADGSNNYNDPFTWSGSWKPSLFMRKKFSRITLEIVDVRVERVRDIGQGDACKEGCPKLHEPIDWFSGLWDSINGKAKPGKHDVSWAANPWVWVIEFKVV